MQNIDSAHTHQPSQVLRRGAGIALAALLSGTASAAPTFNISFDASASVLTTQERNNLTSHLQAAGGIWSRALAITATPSIEIEVRIADIPTANGGSATTAFIGVIGGRDTYEQGVAHELRVNEDPNGPDPDGIITFGLTYLRNELWFDPDPTARTAPVPANRTDAMSTALHEFGHLIAYNGWSDPFTGAPTQSYWSIWDAMILPGSAPAFGGEAATAAWSGTPPALTIGNINHWGNPAPGMHRPVARCASSAGAWRWGAPVPNVCDVPASANAGNAPAGASLIDQLMNGVVFYRGTRYQISALDLGVMIDVGLLDEWIFFNGFDPSI